MIFIGHLYILECNLNFFHKFTNMAFRHLCVQQTLS